MSELPDTRVLVTGATSGLGAAMAAALAGAGAHVIVTSRRLERAQAAAQRLGPGAIGLELDVRDEVSVLACTDEAWDRLGGLDLLVNNAGIGMSTVNPRFLTDPQPFWDVTADGFRDVVETKLTGTFLMGRAVAPRMVAAGGGRIVNISMSDGATDRLAGLATRCRGARPPDRGRRVLRVNPAPQPVNRGVTVTGVGGAGAGGTGGMGTSTSTAPMSQPEPCGRATPR
jgi:NAD(P)-dependent dehydrogenase (short-subunit alcohol dehydrogenase family)